jgi:DNA-binding beta-propeller fold protein YncE
MKLNKLLGFLLSFGAISTILSLTGCQNDAPPPTPEPTKKDTVAVVVPPPPPPKKIPVYYNKVSTVSKVNLPSGFTPKSLVMRPTNTHVYSMNLEGMNVYEYDRAGKKVSRILEFERTPARGFDYSAKKWIASHQEKPVEANFSHDGRYLWVSWHNGDGVIVWDLEDENAFAQDTSTRNATVRIDSISKKIKVKYIRTGSTPKVITPTHDGKYMLVSNWHSYTISFIDIASASPMAWQVVKDVKVDAIPRGMSVSEDNSKAYIALMGGGKVTEISLSDFSILGSYSVGAAPRHIISKEDTLFLSLNSGQKVLQFSTIDKKIIRSAVTNASPRTIEFNPDKTLLFVANYKGNTIQIFNASTLQLLHSIPSLGSPIGLAIYQQGEDLEVWIGKYTLSAVEVFTCKLAN